VPETLRRGYGHAPDCLSNGDVTASSRLLTEEPITKAAAAAGGAGHNGCQGGGGGGEGGRRGRAMISLTGDCAKNKKPVPKFASPKRADDA
jgi:hypothetical protein